MNSKPIASIVLLAIAALAACSSTRTTPGGSGSTDPPATPPGPTLQTPSSDDPAGSPAPPHPVATREFECYPQDVAVDTDLPALTSSESLILRPSGAPCANHLVYKSATAVEHTVSTTPGMIVLADVKPLLGGDLVACLSNERHSQVAGGGPLDRYSDGVELECAVRTSAWSATVTVVPSSSTYATWLVAILPHPKDPARFTVRWLRDSRFQFLDTMVEGRPPSDGLYETQVSVKAGALVVGGTTAKLAIPMFETSANIEEK
jgi:hypothetical protein